jgi:hypothetical protein
MTMRLLKIVTVAAGLAGMAWPAQAADLEGTWSGGGTIVFASGGKENARCKASFERISARQFNVSASCATASARVDQVARVHQVGDNTFAGRFTNADYNVSGNIKLTVNGRSQTVQLVSDGASGTFSLRKN